MRIRTDILMKQDLHAACPEGVSVVELRETRSRNRARGFDVFLTGSSPRRSAHYVDSWGCYPPAATYDEWGIFLADLYGRDQDMIAGPYNGLNDFCEKTQNEFTVSYPYVAPTVAIVPGVLHRRGSRS